MSQNINPNDETIPDIWFRLNDALMTKDLPAYASALRPPSLRDACYAYALAMRTASILTSEETIESFVNGLELGAMNRLIPTLSIIGSTGVNFDSAQFGWLGSPASDTNLCIVSKATPVHSIDDLLEKEVIVGTDGVQRYFTVMTECAQASKVRFGAR